MRTSPFNSVRTVLQDFRYFESNDLDDTCERITTILQPHRLVPGKRGGPIHSHMDFLQLSGFGFCTLKYGSEMDVEVTGLADYHVLIFCLSGGGALLQNMDERLRRETGLPVQIAEEPLSSVVLGAGKMLSDFNLLRKISID
jgi:hypothetical protein